MEYLVFTNESGFYEEHKDEKKIHYSELCGVVLVKKDDFKYLNDKYNLDKLINENYDYICELPEFVDLFYDGVEIKILNTSIMISDYDVSGMIKDLLNDGTIGEGDDLCTHDLCSCKDWGEEIDTIVKTEISMVIRSELKESLEKLNAQGYNFSFTENI
jgi:hypothetical protein